MDELFPQGGAEIELLVRVADRRRYADVNRFWGFWDATPSEPHDIRARAQAVYLFRPFL